MPVGAGGEHHLTLDSPPRRVAGMAVARASSVPTPVQVEVVAVPLTLVDARQRQPEVAPRFNASLLRAAVLVEVRVRGDSAVVMAAREQVEVVETAETAGRRVRVTEQHFRHLVRPDQV